MSNNSYVHVNYRANTLLLPEEEAVSVGGQIITQGVLRDALYMYAEKPDLMCDMVIENIYVYALTLKKHKIAREIQVKQDQVTRLEKAIETKELVDVEEDIPF